MALILMEQFSEYAMNQNLGCQLKGKAFEGVCVCVCVFMGFKFMPNLLVSF